MRYVPRSVGINDQRSLPFLKHHFELFSGHLWCRLDFFPIDHKQCRPSCDSGCCHEGVRGRDPQTCNCHQKIDCWQHHFSLIVQHGIINANTCKWSYCACYGISELRFLPYFYGWSYVIFLKYRRKFSSRLIWFLAVLPNVLYITVVYCHGACLPSSGCIDDDVGMTHNSNNITAIFCACARWNKTSWR